MVLYLLAMAPSLEVRRDRFAEWVRRVTEQMKLSRGWSITRIAEEAGIGDQTIYRWRGGDWKESPKPGQIVAFADACDISPQEAFAILWPGKNDVAPAPEPLGLADPDLLLIAQRLADPNVDEREKWYIQQQLQSMLARPKTSADRPGRTVQRRPRKAS